MIKLLAAKQQQQPPPRTAASENRPQGATQPSPGPYDGSASDCDSIDPRHLVSEKPADGLKYRFLDRLAEVLARDKSFISPSGSKSLQRNRASAQKPRSREAGFRDSGIGHIAAASLIEKDGSAVVLVVKNRGLDELIESW